MPGSKLVKEIFGREKIAEDVDDSIAKKISKRKKEIFKEIQNSRPISGARELLDDLRNCSCLKLLVTGSAKQEIQSILNENIGSNKFDLVITGEDLEEGQGKPDPAPFLKALERMNLSPSETVVVENSPLGVEAAAKAGIPYIITLNNTPLNISDFGTLIQSKNDEGSSIIFKDTISASNFLKEWCCK
jgi:HAD superfamily hydrolase (TIGR01509 family)